ncbi:replicative DNA helicase [Caldicoprobacter guelmensis]|uniref:DUF4363 family protein n=1 Tax=Caldicoprobacter guelmensis TaxID=1170224 RepID=UPI0019580FD3|nr:DUF4363 family protein [Caldicoprobacter guelmensis]MBM7582236.1 replicative DNA helicase [Caldicoprobacter guelmensis]
MKIPFIMLAITIAFFVFAVWTQHSLEASAKKLEHRLTSLESAIKSDSWEMADSELESLTKLWGQTKNSWQIFINHEEIDNIEATLARVKQLVKLQEKTDSLSEISALRLYIAHIPQKESLCLVNIL